MARYEVKVGATESDLIGRPCTLLAGGKKAQGFQIVSRGKCSTVERESLWRIAHDNPLAEYYITLTLAKLREIDRDLLKLEEFLRSRLPRISGKTTNIIVVRLFLEEGDSISNSDLEYLWDLLNISGNDVAVPPILAFPKMVQFNKRIYQKFIQGFLSLSSSYQPNKLACSVPWGLSRGDVAEVLSWYDVADPRFYLMDFGGRKPFSPAQEMIISSVLRKVNELHENEFYLYGFDVKPHKPGRDELPAENLLLLASGFNAVGPRRTPPRMSPQMIQRLRSSGPQPIPQSIRIFQRSDYGFHKLAEPGASREFGAWLPSLQSIGGRITIRSINDPSQLANFQRLGRAFNYSVQSPEASLLAVKVGEQKLKEHLLTKDQAKKVVPRIEKIRKTAQIRH